VLFNVGYSTQRSFNVGYRYIAELQHSGAST